MQHDEEGRHRVLIAEDNVISRRLIEVHLKKWGYDVVSTKDGAEALEMLQKDDPPRLALLDWMMPNIDGVEVCRRVRESRREPYTYILLLTAKGEKSDLVEAIEAGADDYITKPFDHRELEVRLRAGNRILDLQDRLIAARETLRVQATHDALTGLLNRPAILNILEKEMVRASRENVNLGLAISDLDHFKRINDTYGHLAGDAVLQETAKRMSAAIRSYDSVGRYGGEEFLIIFVGCVHSDLVNAAERIRKAICASPIIVPGGPLSITMSVGLVSVQPVAGKKADQQSVIRVADTALYEAKAAGRNCIKCATYDFISDNLDAVAANVTVANGITGNP